MHWADAVWQALQILKALGRLLAALLKNSVKAICDREIPVDWANWSPQSRCAQTDGQTAALGDRARAGEAQSKWNDLPGDLQSAIFRRFSDKGALRLVCKSWSCQISHPHVELTTRGWASSFAASFPRLEVLEFRRHSSVNLGDLKTLPTLSQLKFLDFSHQMSVGDSALQIASRLPRLRVLKLNHCPNITDIGLGYLRQDPMSQTLRELDLSFCQGITDDGVANLGSGMRGLHYLNLKLCTDVDGWGIHGFVRIDSPLRSLNFGYKTKLSQFSEYTRHSESIFSSYPAKGYSHILQGLTALTVLDLSFCDVTNRLVEGIAHHLIHLAALNLTHCSLISWQGFCALGELKRLEHLNISDNCLIDRNIELLHPLKNLQTLDISLCTRLKGESALFLTVLINLPGLKHLSLHFCRESLLDILRANTHQIRFRVSCDQFALQNQQPIEYRSAKYRLPIVAGNELLPRLARRVETL